MFCLSCGMTLPDEASYCPKCGKKVVLEHYNYIPKTEEPKPKEEQHYEYQPDLVAEKATGIHEVRDKSDNSGGGVAIVVLILMILTIVIGIVVSL